MTETNSPDWEQRIRVFADSDLEPEELRQEAATLLDNADSVIPILHGCEGIRTKFVDKIDEAFPNLDLQNKKYIDTLGVVCGTLLRLPTSAVLYMSHGQIYESSGGVIKTGRNSGTLLAMKTLATDHLDKADNDRAKKVLFTQVPVWMRLCHHPNILPFRGVDMTEKFRFSLVYDWEENGNIAHYIHLDPNASRLSLLLDVARGLEYLHSLDIPHGRLKLENIVIDEQCHARLTDYGLDPFHSGLGHNEAADQGPTRVKESKMTDVFAFGIVVLKVLTGQVSFWETNGQYFIDQTVAGDFPEIPRDLVEVGLTDDLRVLFGRCLQQEPNQQPTIEDVVKESQKLIKDAILAFEKSGFPQETTPERIWEKLIHLVNTVECPTLTLEKVYWKKLARDVAMLGWIPQKLPVVEGVTH